MLPDIELPGFPPPDNRRKCLDCEVLVPVGHTEDNPTCYTDAELASWEAALPPCGADTDQTFPDPRGLTVEHDGDCTYYGLPPIALWQESKSIADRVHEKLWQARQPCP